LELGRTIQALATGTKVSRVIDRDMRSKEEVEALVSAGVRVLSRRHIESYLLDDEVIAALCTSVEQPDKIVEALAIKERQIAASMERKNDRDDMKSPAGEIYNDLRRLLMLTHAGSDWNAFARDTLSPLIRTGMVTYEELKQDIFGNGDL
jgi:hypothetical protein